jgi:acetoin utilization protein AcuB
MLENKVSCLPVLDDGRVTGILTQSDIYRAFIETMGVLEPGTRIQIYAPDLTAALAGVVRVAAERQVRVVGVHSEPGRRPGEAGLVVRFGTAMLAGLVHDLRGAGLDVVEPDPTTPGTAS